MKITKSQLKQIIKEELENALNEKERVDRFETRFVFASLPPEQQNAYYKIERTVVDEASIAYKEKRGKFMPNSVRDKIRNNFYLAMAKKWNPLTGFEGLRALASRDAHVASAYKFLQKMAPRALGVQ